jgi:3-oxoacyl-(acyl-carrier-protein) synthase
MDKVVITGAGLVTAVLNSLTELKGKNIDDFHELSVKDIEHFIHIEREFKAKKLIEREDRSLLNKDSKLLLDACLEAFTNSEIERVFVDEEKKQFPIFIANDASPYKFEDFQAFLEKYSNEINTSKTKEIWKNLGKLKEFFNPLDMLRMLSTNPLYQVSKMFNLHGGGYPIRRMSLSSLCALEEAFYRIESGEKRAVVAAVGDLTVPENYCAFERMNIIKHAVNDKGMVPSFGAASIILEKQSQKTPLLKKYFAEIIDCRTIFKPNNNIVEMDWRNLFNAFKERNLNDLSIVSYDNGNPNLANEENLALKKYFPNSTVYNYKRYIGYTGKANNLIDVVIALSDKRIEVGNHILINGVGNYTGLGYLLVKKLHHLNG